MENLPTFIGLGLLILAAWALIAHLVQIALLHGLASGGGLSSVNGNSQYLWAWPVLALAGTAVLVFA